MNHTPKFLLAALALFIAGLNSCRLGNLTCIRGAGPSVSQTHNARNFDAVKIETQARINLIADSVFSITLHGQQNLIDNLNIFVSGNTLIIRNKHCTLGNSNLTIDIHAPAVRAIDLSGSGSVIFDPGKQKLSDVNFRVSGSGKISCTDKINCNNMDIRITGSGLLEADADCDNMNTEISGSGKAELTGKCSTHDVQITGSGRLEANELESENAHILVSGSGKAFVFCTKSLRAEITGSGRVIYRGEPTVNTRITGSGSVTHQ